jgi:hypothetical protein
LSAENVSELLAAAHLHDAEPLKTHAVAFIKGNAEAVMTTEGWAELVKNPALVNYVVGTMARPAVVAIPRGNSQQQGGGWFASWFS